MGEARRKKLALIKKRFLPPPDICSRIRKAAIDELSKWTQLCTRR